MYGDQFEEFVCGYWGLKGKVEFSRIIIFRWMMQDSCLLSGA